MLEYVRGRKLFEWWDFCGGYWKPVSLSTSVIKVEPDIEYLFVRSVGIHCKNFGRWLAKRESNVGAGGRRYEGMNDIITATALEPGLINVVWWRVSAFRREVVRN